MGAVSCWSQQLHLDSSETLSCCFNTWDDSVHPWSCSAGFKNQLDIIFCQTSITSSASYCISTGAQSRASVWGWGVQNSCIQPRKWVRDVAPLWNQANTENRKSPTSNASISPPSFISHLFCNKIFFLREGFIIISGNEISHALFSTCLPSHLCLVTCCFRDPHSTCADNSGMAPFLLNQVGKAASSVRNFFQTFSICI